MKCKYLKFLYILLVEEYKIIELGEYLWIVFKRLKVFKVLVL